MTSPATVRPRCDAVPNRAPKRVDDLARAFFATTPAQDPSLNALRYQLFSALAGTLADARQFGAAHAALVVHEFITPLTDPAKQRLNAADLEAFVRRLGAAERRAGSDSGWLAGPFTVPGNAHLPGDVPFYIGKLFTRVAHRGDDEAEAVALASTPATAAPR